MKDLEGYYDELQLQEMLTNGEIKKIDYILHHDENMTENYRDFCKKGHLEYGSDKSADVYFSYLTEMEEKEMMEANNYSPDDDMENDNPDHVDSKEVPYCVKLYNEWNQNSDLIEEMKSDIEAVLVTRWRMMNPMDNNKEDCATSCDIDEVTVDKWWDVINYVIGATGGYPVNAVNFNVNTIQQLIKNAVPKKIA